MIEILIAAWLMGLLGSGHCMGMCGGLSSALAFGMPTQGAKFPLLLASNLGRIASYSLLGALVGLLASGVTSSHALWPRLVAGSLLVLTGLSVARVWQGIRVLEHLGGYIWRFIKPISSRLLPLNSLPKALVFGALWGWLPCGLVYTALALAASQASVFSAGVMLAFGLGTLPGVLASGLMAAQIKPWLQKTFTQRLLGAAFVAFGLWTLVSALAHSGHAHHSPAGPSEQPAAQDHSHHHH